MINGKNLALFAIAPAAMCESIVIYQNQWYWLIPHLLIAIWTVWKVANVDRLR